MDQPKEQTTSPSESDLSSFAAQAHALDEAVRKDRELFGKLPISDKDLTDVFLDTGFFSGSTGRQLSAYYRLGVEKTLKEELNWKPELNLKAARQALVDALNNTQTSETLCEIFPNAVAFFNSTGIIDTEIIADSIRKYLEMEKAIIDQEAKCIYFRSKDHEVLTIMDDGDLIWNPNTNAIIKDESQWEGEPGQKLRHVLSNLLVGSIKASKYLQIKSDKIVASQGDSTPDGIYALIRVGDLPKA